MGTKYIPNSASEKKSNIYLATCHEIHDQNVVESVRAGRARSEIGSNPAYTWINSLRELLIPEVDPELMYLSGANPCSISNWEVLALQDVSMYDLDLKILIAYICQKRAIASNPRQKSFS